MTIKQKFVPKKILFFGKAWLASPLLLLVYSVTAMGVNSEGIAKILLGPSFWLVSTFAVWTGYALAHISWYAWHLFLFSNFLMAYEVALVLAYHSTSSYKLLLLLGSLLLQTLVILIVRKEIRVPYYAPRIRWWESDPRYKLSVKTGIRTLNEEGNATGITETAEIVDISRGGCFVKTNLNHAMDTVLSLTFELFGKEVSCIGQVVWQTESTITHPKGIGVRFINLDRKTIQLLKDGMSQLKQMAQTYTEMVREKNWQEYLEREKQFQLHRRGGAAHSNIPATEIDHDPKPQGNSDKS